MNEGSAKEMDGGLRGYLQHSLCGCSLAIFLPSTSYPHLPPLTTSPSTPTMQHILELVTRR